MKLKSFGCSLIFGTDLSDDGHDGTWSTPSQFSWPALVAKKLNLEYHCYARPGSGNFQIWSRFIDQLTDPEPAFYLIGWTFIDRFDFISDKGVGWVDGPRRWRTILPADTDDIANIYYEEMHTELRDKLSSITLVKSAIDLLSRNNQKFYMTYVDPLLLDQRWNTTPGMTKLQEEAKKYLSDFEGRNFVDWSRHRGFDISASGHPLESAHAAAAELMAPKIDAILHRA